jgi:hypothetical protein
MTIMPLSFFFWKTLLIFYDILDNVLNLVVYDLQPLPNVVALLDKNN